MTIGGKEAGRVPIFNVESIVMFGRMGASAGLMGLCVDNNVSLTFMTAHGRYVASVVGKTKGNVLLRREQYRIADDEQRSLAIARNMIVGKVVNSKQVLYKFRNNHPDVASARVLDEKMSELNKSLENMIGCASMGELRGLEGAAAEAYFSFFDNLILKDKDEFVFRSRNRRPPRDKVNAMLSFAYSLLANDVKSALESVGLDPYVGFMHTDRPGRPSLALDLMEELRPLADRFVLKLINLRIMDPDGFICADDGAVLLDDNGRSTFLEQWQELKHTERTHPFLDEKIQIGLLPFIQASLLAKCIRGEIDGYPPFSLKDVRQ